MTEDAAMFPTGAALCRDLAEFARIRDVELSAMYESVLSVVAAYRALISEVVWIVGGNPPSSSQDAVVRDLVADVFDFLSEWQRPLMEGRLNVGFPLGRRAYESLSLMNVCVQDAAMAQRWADGKEIGNAEVRKALAKLPLREAEEDTRALYGFFSEGSHPNRSLVAMRYLGDGNQFTLGSIGKPNLVLVTMHSIHLLEMWFWYGTTVLYSFKEVVRARSETIGPEYLRIANEAKTVRRWLTEQLPRLIEEENA